jgi:hypothetical protein
VAPRVLCFSVSLGLRIGRSHTPIHSR